MIRNSITLLQYAGYLLVIGLASTFYNASTGEVGFNKHGVTGLYACGGSALVAGAFGVLVGKGREWAAWAGLALAFLLMAYGGKTLFTIIRDVDGNALDLMKKRAEAGEPLTETAARGAMQYKAVIFGALFVFSVMTFLKLGLALRRGKTA